MAKLWKLPASTVVQLELVPIWIGRFSSRVELSVEPPWPSWPKLSRPQLQIVPFVLIANEWNAPALMPAQSAFVPTITGERRNEFAPVLASTPMPNSPDRFMPQAQIVPSARRARLKNPPARTSTQAESVPTRTGEVEFALVDPMPSWPNSLPPHVQILPSRFKPMPCVAPAST